MQSIGASIWNGSIYGIETSISVILVLASAAILVNVMGKID
jgi:hypothetical protein